MRKFSARALLCCSLSCTALLGATSAHAAPPNEDDTTVTMARERFKEGVAFFDQKQYDKARVAFLQAYALKKHPAVLLNLAQSELRSNHEADAAKHFSAFLRESPTTSDAERQAAEAGLNATKSMVALLDVNVDEDGAEISVDGSTEGVSPLPGPLYVTPGSHSIEARKNGKTRTQQINTNAGRQYSADLKFTPKPQPAPVPTAPPTPLEEPAEPEAEPAHTGEPRAGRKPFFKWLFTSPVGLVGFGLTGVGVGGGIGLAIASKKSYQDADSVAGEILVAAAKDSGMATPNTSGLCTNPKDWLQGFQPPGQPMDAAAIAAFNKRTSDYNNACSKYQDNVSTGDRMKTLSTVGFVVGGVAAVGTIIYYFVDPNARESGASEARNRQRRISLIPSVGPAHTGLTLVGSF